MLITGGLDRHRRGDRAPGRRGRLSAGARGAHARTSSRPWPASSAAPSGRSPSAATSREWADNEALAAAALDAFGRIDAVFANAGFGATRGFLEETPEQWRSMVLTNVLGVAYTIRATLPHLLERGSGHYVITSSVAGRRVLPGSMYSASKWAVTAIGEALRQELARRTRADRIRVT